MEVVIIIEVNYIASCSYQVSSVWLDLTGSLPKETGVCREDSLRAGARDEPRPETTGLAEPSAQAGIVVQRAR